MYNLRIKQDNFHILENLEDNLKNVKYLYIQYLPENYELVLKGYKILENIEFINLKGKNVILEDLDNLLKINIECREIILTLNKGLNKLEEISTNPENTIIDNFNYLENIESYKLYMGKIREDEHIILDDKFKNITEIDCVRFIIELNLEEFPRLKYIICDDSIIYGKSKFPLLKTFQIINADLDEESNSITDLDNFFLTNSELPSLKEFSINRLYVDKNITKKVLKPNNFFTNLETLIIDDTNIEYLDFKVNEDNPIIKKLKLSTKIKVSGSLFNKFPENVRKNYELILPMKKSANNIFYINFT